MAELGFQMPELRFQMTKPEFRFQGVTDDVSCSCLKSRTSNYIDCSFLFQSRTADAMIKS
jgi:hypothetical protein